MSVKTILANFVLTLLIACLVMIFMILCNQYNKTHYYAAVAYNEMKATEYRMKAEQYRMETVKLHLEVEEARLNLFIKAYGGNNASSKQN